MWDNFARLTALLAKVRVWFDNLTIYLDFSAIFSQIAPSEPLNQGRHWGRLFAAEGRRFDEASNVTPLFQLPCRCLLYASYSSHVGFRTKVYNISISFQEQQKADESRNSRLETLNQEIDVMLEKVNISSSNTMFQSRNF